MLNYTKLTNTRRTIPRTYGRYSVNIYYELWDNLHQIHIDWVDHNGELVFPKLGTIYDLKYNPEEIVCLTYKPLHITDEYLEDVILLKRKPYEGFICHPTLYVWKFIKGLELPMYPGFRIIPGFSRYLVNASGSVISVHCGKYLEQHVSSVGYPTCRIVRDDDLSKLMSVHVLVALAWLEYDQNVCDMEVDHLDGNRLNSNCNNLEWVTPCENKRRARLHNYGAQKKQLWIRNIKTGDKASFADIAELSRYLDVAKSSIYSYLNSANPNAVFKQTYIIWYDGCGDGEITDGHLMNREGSQKRSVLVKNVIDESISEYNSVVDFIKDSGLSRKRVYGNLISGKQKLYGNLIFKYSDDPSEWII